MATPDGPPPSRFRVEERGGRLVVIDTVTGATPPTAQQRQAAWGDQHNAIRHAADGDAAGATPIVHRPAFPPPEAAPTAQRTTPSPPHALGTGGRTFMTKASYDAKGPRRVTFSPTAMAQAQVIALAAVGLSLLIFMLAYAFDLTLVLLVTMIVLVKGASHVIAKTGARLIDRLSHA